MVINHAAAENLLAWAAFFVPYLTIGTLLFFTAVSQPNAVRWSQAVGLFIFLLILLNACLWLINSTYPETFISPDGILRYLPPLLVWLEPLCFIIVLGWKILERKWPHNKITPGIVKASEMIFSFFYVSLAAIFAGALFYLFS